MKGKWPKPATSEAEFTDFVDALEAAHRELPGHSFGKLIQAATVIRAGYWPGTLKQVTNQDLQRGLEALIPDPDETNWVIPEDEVESTYV